MTENKTTQKDLYARIAALLADDPEIVEFCEKKIAQIERNAARPRKTKVNQEVVNFRQDVLNKLTEIGEPVTNKDMAAEFGVSAQKMSAALRFLVKEGRVTRIEGEKKSSPATFVVAEDGDIFEDDAE
jgi:predicted Rossmann fold nucleotide-binding protein DprA/Smf involved in DNA uptake